MKMYLLKYKTKLPNCVRAKISTLGVFIFFFHPFLWLNGTCYLSCVVWDYSEYYCIFIIYQFIIAVIISELIWHVT